MLSRHTLSHRRRGPHHLRHRRCRRPVRDLNFKYMQEGKGATVTARFGADGITIIDPNSAEVFQNIYDKALCERRRPPSPRRRASRKNRNLAA
jgi:hypothetical protein